MRIILGAVLLLIIGAVAFSLAPGSWLASYENKGLGLISGATGILLTLGAILAALMYGLHSPRTMYLVLVHPKFRIRNRLSPLDRKITKAFILAAIAESSTVEPAAGTVIHEAMSRIEDFPEFHGDSIWPRQLERANLEIRDVAQGLRNSPAARFFIPERAHVIAQTLERVYELLEQLTQGSVIALSELQGDMSRADLKRGLFADFVTEFTGALVFADGVHTRSGFARGVRVFHRGKFRSEQSDALNSSSPRVHLNYEQSHGNGLGSEECVFRNEFRNPSPGSKASRARADEFDGNVVELLAVELSRDSRQSGVNFTLVTGESCYAATEVSTIPDAEGGVRKPNALQSKKLESVVDDEFAPRWVFDSKFASVAREHPISGRVALLTVSALVIQESTEADSRHPSRSVVLLKRPKKGAVRNGDGVLAPPGGVMTINRGSLDADIDGDLVPDPVRAIQLELAEELGLNLEPEALTPLSVSMSNDCGPSKNGQLVATVGFRTSVSATKSDLERLQQHSSSHAGKYEALGLHFVDIPAEAEIAKLDDRGRKRAAQKYAESWKEIVGRLDQRTIVAALYLGAEMFGPETTANAFRDVWDKNWFEFQWDDLSDEPIGKLGRLARPTSLLGW